MKIFNLQMSLLAASLATALISWAKPDLETVFFPVVGQIELVEGHKVDDGVQEVYVEFDKFRDCDFIGLRMNDPLGYRVNFNFLDKTGDSYHSRPEGFNIAGPWRLFTNFEIEELHIEAVHECKGFLGDYRVVSVMNDGK